MKRRIIRADSLNWAIQEYQEGGETISRGRYAGQKTEAKWKIPNAFFPSLPDALKSFLHDSIGDMPNGSPVTGQEIISRIEAAESSVVEAIEASVKDLETSFLIGLLQERGYTVTDGKKGRTSYTDE